MKLLSTHIRCIIQCLMALLIFNLSLAKTSELDSLKLALKNAKVDSTKTDIIYNIAQYYNNAGSYNESIDQFNILLALHKKNNYKFGIAEAYNNIGLIYEKQGNYQQAIKAFFNSLKIWEETGDQFNIISGYINIALLYDDIENYDDALKNCEKALMFCKKTNDKRYLGYCYNTFGVTYYYKGNQTKALECHLNALKFREEVGDKPEIAASLNNLGIAYVDLGDKAKKDGDEKLATIYFRKAQQNYSACLKIAVEFEDKASIAMSDLNSAVLNTKLKNYKEAKKQTANALSIFTEIGSKEGLKETYKALFDLDSLNGMYKDAYIHYRMYITYRDSLVNQENAKKTIQTQMQYDFDKKESIQKAVQEKKDAVYAEELRVQKTIRYAFTIGFVMVLALVIVVYRSYTEKQKANKLLADKNHLIELQKIDLEQKNEELNQQNEEISTQRDEIENQKQLVDDAFEKLNEKNKEVMDSIKYASRIQRALLTPEKYIERELNKLMKKD